MTGRSSRSEIYYYIFTNLLFTSGRVMLSEKSNSIRFSRLKRTAPFHFKHIVTFGLLKWEASKGHFGILG